MKILYVVQHFSGPEGTSGSRAYENARRLVARGHEVTLLCAQFEHGTSGDLAAARAAGIRILQAPILYGQKLSFARRILAFIRYMPWAVRTGRRLPSPDVVLASSTPLTVGEIGRRVARHHRIPFVFEVRDLWPEVPIALGALRNPVLRWAARRLASICYRAAAHVVALSPDMRAGILRTGVPPECVTVVPNCSDTDLFGGPQDRAGMRRRFDWSADELVCIHPGAMGLVNGLDAVVDCGRQLDAAGIADIHLALVGRGSQRARLEARLRDEGVQCVSIHDPVPKKEMPALLAAADVGLMTVAPIPELQANSANKFFDFLAAGLPVVLNYGGWQAEVLRESGAGLAAPPGDVPGLVALLKRLRTDPAERERMGRAARKLAEERFDRDKLVGEIEQVLIRVTAFRGTGRPGSAAKRILDMLAAVAGLALLSPVLLVAMVGVRLDLGAQVFFCQTRPGLRGKPFRLWKFRTMSDARDAQGNLLPDERRLTRLGRFLRATSLDELPELWNVLKGDMSLVGPRPLLLEYLPLYTPEQARRHEVRPGITGWAQVNGRNALSWEEKFALDVWYVDHANFLLDLRILWLTLRQVLRREGISAEGHATMPKFRGSGPQENR